LPGNKIDLAKIEESLDDFIIKGGVEIPWWLTTLFRLSVTIIFRDAKQFIPQ
jgi:hypothetical protein